MTREGGVVAVHAPSTLGTRSLGSPAGILNAHTRRNNGYPTCYYRCTVELTPTIRSLTSPEVCSMLNTSFFYGRRSVNVMQRNSRATVLGGCTVRKRKNS